MPVKRERRCHKGEQMVGKPGSCCCCWKNQRKMPGELRIQSGGEVTATPAAGRALSVGAGTIRGRPEVRYTEPK